jgi:hypothetical protein
MPQSLLFEFGLVYQMLVDRRHMFYVVATLVLSLRPRQGTQMCGPRVKLGSHISCSWESKIV